MRREHGLICTENIIVLNIQSAFIDGVPYISDLQKEFYKRYIEARLDVLLRPVFEMTELTETEQTGPTISL